MITLDTPIKKIMADEKAMAIVEKHLGDLIHHKMVKLIKGMSLNKVYKLANGLFSQEQLDAIGKDFETLE